MKDSIVKLANRDDELLLKPHPEAPAPFPEVPLGVVVQLDHAAARAALQCVPRLQRKHYELIPKTLSEIDFWVNFFSHVTAAISKTAPELLSNEVAPSQLHMI